MFYPRPKDADTAIYDMNSEAVIVGYVSENQTIHIFEPKNPQALYNAKSASVVLRFPRTVIDSGKCVMVDIDNCICRYINDMQGVPYTFTSLQNQSVVLPVYTYCPDFNIQNHQGAPFNPVYSAEDMILGKPDIESEIIQAFNPHNSDDSKAYDEGENDGSEAKPDTATESAITDKETNESILQPARTKQSTPYCATLLFTLMALSALWVRTV